jgi:hypothetical protein
VDGPEILQLPVREADFESTVRAALARLDEKVTDGFTAISEKLADHQRVLHGNGRPGLIVHVTRVRRDIREIRNLMAESKESRVRRIGWGVSITAAAIGAGGSYLRDLVAWLRSHVF